MRLLLDTCIVYDGLMGVIADRPLIERIQTEDAFVSSVSVWEMAIKYSLGQPLPPLTSFEYPEADDVGVRPLTPLTRAALPRRAWER